MRALSHNRLTCINTITFFNQLLTLVKRYFKNNQTYSRRKYPMMTKSEIRLTNATYILEIATNYCKM